jgi:hypothetical protein
MCRRFHAYISRYRSPAAPSFYCCSSVGEKCDATLSCSIKWFIFQHPEIGTLRSVLDACAHGGEPSKSYGPRGCDVYSAFRSSQIDTCTSCSAPLSVKLFVPAITCILISAQLCVTKKQQVRQPCVIGIGVSLAYPDALGETNRHRSCSRYTVENDRFKSKREMGKAPAGCSAQPINNRYQIKRVKRMLSQ